MKIFFTTTLSILQLIAISQITIVSSNLPNAGDILVTEAATLTGDVEDTDTGIDHVWTFDEDVLQLTGVMTNTTCYDVASTPFVYQYLFNNPFDPDHNSDFAQGVDEFTIATLQFTNAYQYFKVGNGKYAITGLGASINDFPLASQKDGIEILFNLPLEFGDSGESDSELFFEIPTLGSFTQELNRTYNCDGWGTLNLFDQSYDVLRLRSVVNANDSIYVDFLQNGITIPEPEVITYEWWTPTFSVPVLKVTKTNDLVTSVQVADIYNVGPTSVENSIETKISLYPNPVKDILRINLPDQINSQIQLFDSHGKLLGDETNPHGIVDMSSYAPGLYTLRIITNRGVRAIKVMKI